jgi:hypothetical protein
MKDLLKRMDMFPRRGAREHGEPCYQNSNQRVMKACSRLCGARRRKGVLCSEVWVALADGEGGGGGGGGREKGGRIRKAVKYRFTDHGRCGAERMGPGREWRAFEVAAARGRPRALCSQ